jgi:nucleoside-diphosphate-sugar epimerase
MHLAPARGFSMCRPLDAVGRSPFTEWHYKTAFVPFFCDIEPAVAGLGWRPKFSNVDALYRAYEYFLTTDGSHGESAHLSPLKGGLARLLRGS